MSGKELRRILSAVRFSYYIFTGHESTMCLTKTCCMSKNCQNQFSNLVLTMVLSF